MQSAREHATLMSYPATLANNASSAESLFNYLKNINIIFSRINRSVQKTLITCVMVRYNQSNIVRHHSAHRIDNTDGTPSLRAPNPPFRARPDAGAATRQAFDGLAPYSVVTIPSRLSLEDGINRLASGETNLDSYFCYPGTNSGRGTAGDGSIADSEHVRARLGMPAPTSASAFANLSASRL